MRTFIAALIGPLHPTSDGAVLPRSIVVDRRLLEAADIAPYERVTLHVERSGAAWEGYVVPSDEPGVFVPDRRGPAIMDGDEVTMIAYRQEPCFGGARMVLVDDDNEEIAEGRDWLPADPQAERLDPALIAARRSGFEVRV